MSKLLNWIEKLSDRANRDMESLDVKSDSALRRFAGSVEARVASVEADDPDTPAV